MDIRNFFKPTNGKSFKIKVNPKSVAEKTTTNNQEPTEPITNLNKVTPTTTTTTISPSPAAPSKSTKLPAWKKVAVTPTLAPASHIPTGKEGILLGNGYFLDTQFPSPRRTSLIELIGRCGGVLTDTLDPPTTHYITPMEEGGDHRTTAHSLGVAIMDEEILYATIRSLEPTLPSVEISSPQVPPPKASSGSKKIKLSVKPSGFSTQPAPVVKPEVDLEVAPIVPSPTAAVSTPPPIKELPRLNIVSQRPIEPKLASNLWVDKYKPQTIRDLCGNNGHIQEMVSWLSRWNPRDSQGVRAVLVSGPPGIGKSSSALLACQQTGFSPIEFNASDTRNKSSIESILGELVDNRSISEFFKPTHQTTPTTQKTKPALILDEIDGMSGGDRGGVAEIIKYIKKTKVPIICICNDRMSPKVRSLANHCKDLRFTRPSTASVLPRIEFIARNEGLTLDYNVIDKLVEMTGGDIRQVINLLSTWRLSQSHMSFQASKDYSKALQKNTVLDPFKIASKFLGGAEYQSHTFSEKLEFYFHDFQIAPLMVQENYIKAKPQAVSRIHHPQHAQLEHLDRLSKAADSICEADLLDRSIHSSQNWGLMPTHAAFSCLMPAHHMHGQLQGRIDFPQWLGKNSSANKYARLLRETHLHMKSRISGDKHEVRATYLPALVAKLTQPLIHRGQAGIPDVITVMDHYYLDKEDWDTLVDLQAGADRARHIRSAIPTPVKSAFTRTYNKQDHPHLLRAHPTSVRGSKATAPVPLAAGWDEAPVAPTEEEEVAVDDEGDDQDSDDVQGDALISQRTTKPKSKAKSTTTATKRKSTATTTNRATKKSTRS